MATLLHVELNLDSQFCQDQVANPALPADQALGQLWMDCLAFRQANSQAHQGDTPASAQGVTQVTGQDAQAHARGAAASPTEAGWRPAEFGLFPGCG